MVVDDHRLPVANPSHKMHRAGQRCFELLALIASLSFSNKVIPQLDKTLGQTGQTLRACTMAEAF